MKKLSRKQLLGIGGTTLLVIIVGIFWASTAFGVTRTWDGGGANANWDNNLNWSGDTVPTSADIAQFDGTCVTNCDATINVSLSGGSAPAGINIAAGYAGTITQSGSNTITLGSSGWAQAAGSFQGGSGAITINGNFTLSGGIATSTSGTLTIGNCGVFGGSWTHTVGGTFNHNNGTVVFTESGTVDVASSETFNNVTRSCSGRTTTVASGDTLVVLGTFTHTDGSINTGTIEARGNVVVGNGGSIPGSATLSFLIGGDQTITASGGSTISLNIAKSSGNVSVVGDLATDNVTISGGTFIAPSGNLRIGTCGYNGGNFTHTAGGAFTHNTGTVEFNQTGTVDVASSETFYNLNKTCNGGTMTVASGDTLVVLNTFTHTDGRINTGTVEVQGNMVIGSVGTYGNATISFLVAGDQTITGSGGMTSSVNINKPSGTVSASGNMGFTNLTISGGTFSSTPGTLTIGVTGFSGGSWTHTAGGTFNHRNGTVTFSSDNATIDVSTSETFGKLVVTGAGRTLTIASGDTLVVRNTYTHTSATLNGGTIEAQGDVIIGASSGGGTASTTFSGPNMQTYTDQGGNVTDGNVSVNKSGGSVTLASNANWNAASQQVFINSGDFYQKTFTISTTKLRVSGGNFYGGSGTISIQSGAGGLVITSGLFRSTSGQLFFDNGTWYHTGGTFEHNNGFVNSLGHGTWVNQFTLASPETFYDLETNEGGSGGQMNLGGGTIITLGLWTYDWAGMNNGTVEAWGNVWMYGSIGGSANLTFKGPNNQTYTNTASGGAGLNGTITINKPSGSVTLLSDTNWSAGQLINITSGTLLQTGSYSATTSNTVTISSGGAWIANGTGRVALGGGMVNNGLVDFRSNNTCGGTDSMILHSTISGTQRAWSGSGTTVIRDVDVKDQGGSLAITAYSSSNTARNGGNWTFSTSGCPNVPPGIGVSNGRMNVTSGRTVIQ